MASRDHTATGVASSLPLADARPSFTPGPWRALPSPFCDRIEAVAHPGSCIAETGNWLMHEKGEQHANARLIAAAPDLYEVVERALWCLQGAYYPGLLADMRAALAKAAPGASASGSELANADPSPSPGTTSNPSLERNEIKSEDRK